jgi:hypothetical protein
MHEPEEQQQLDQTTQEELQRIDLLAAYKVFVRAFCRVEFSNNSSKEDDHA